MDSVTVGVGELDGRGLYAARNFAAGEVVVAFELRALTAEQFDALTPGEELFVHSYGGRRWLYPPPARWVNHSDQPSCCQDFERCCDVALRPIAVGEAITIDALQETNRELVTFVEAYVAAQQQNDREGLLGLIASDAVLWNRGRDSRGADQVASMLASNPARGFGKVEWHLGTGRWEALCSAEFTTRESVVRSSLFLRVLAGNWQVVYEHRD